MLRYNPKFIVGEFLIWACNHVIAYVPSHTVRLAFYKYIMRFKVEKNASILIGCSFNCRKNFTIGLNSTINKGCHLDNRGGIFIGNNVSISPKVSIVTADHNLHSSTFEGRVSAVRIENYVFVGYQAVILKGITLGTGSVVSAATCQTKDTVPFGIYGGVPGKLIGKRNEELIYQTTYRRLFH